MERDLSKMRDYIEEAKEIGEELLDSSMMVAVCSEKAAEESSRAASGADVREATPSDLRWNILWRQHHGASFRLKASKPKRAAKPSDAMLAKRSLSF